MTDKSNPRKKTEFTKTFHWFFCDIINSAHPSVPTQEQLLKIQKFYEILSKTSIMQSRDSSRIVVPTGDGYVIGFSDSPEKSLFLARELLQDVIKFNKSKRGKEKLLLRIGIDSGPVYVIKDLVTKKKTFWGPGIIMTKRVMDIGKENHILASKRIAEDIMKLSKEYKSLFHSIGEYEIKHGEKIEIYNVYGKSFGNKVFPRKGKEINKKESDKERRSTNNFRFKKIEIILKVTNPKTMMTSHTFVWDLVNISGKTQPQVLYQLGGDVKKDFSELNVKIKDSNRRNLDIVRVDANRPLYKEFFVKLHQPVKPNRELKGLELEYYWEEPDREFTFELPTDCKKFYFKLIIPNEVQPKVRIFKRVGLSEKQPLDSTINLGKKITEIVWEGKNVHAYDEYIFQW